MKPEIVTLTEKKLVGKHLRMTLSGNRTGDLWRSFMPHRREIRNNLNNELISMQVYDPSLDFKDFNQDTPFEKWAAVEVADFSQIPEGMEQFILKGGLYAVFLHKGAAATGPETFRKIFTLWLPESGYIAESRPHFEVLGEKYKNDDPGSEEEIWIPVKPAKKF